jgi:hypothetical protein
MTPETNVMRVARQAAERVATWSPVKREQAQRIVNAGSFNRAPTLTAHGTEICKSQS